VEGAGTVQVNKTFAPVQRFVQYYVPASMLPSHCGVMTPNNQPMNRMNKIILCGLLLCLFGAGKGYGQESRKFMSEPITSATEDGTYSYSIITGGDPLDSPVLLSGSSLPTWLTLVDNGDGTGTLSGTPQPGNVADHVIRLDVSIKAGVTQIYSTSSAFAALKTDGSVVTWGNSSDGGESSAVADGLSSGVTQIYSTRSRNSTDFGGAFAAVKADGSVVTWGDSSFGGDSSAVSDGLSSGVTQIYSNNVAFSALKGDGSVITWGHLSGGGDSSAESEGLSSGVKEICSTYYAFAALKVDGSVVTWGHSDFGADSSAMSGDLDSGVTQIHSTERAFAVLKTDGSVVTWGDSRYGGNSSSEIGDLGWGVTQIYSNHYAFAALKGDGPVITWGSPTFGGDSSTVSGDLSSGVTQIHSTEMAFAAVKDDGSVVTWGHPSEGGNSGDVANFFCTFTIQDSQEFVITVTPGSPIDLVNVGYVSEPFGFDFESQTGRHYVVEATDDLKEWGVVKSYNGTGTMIRFEDERDQVFPQIYYRVRVVE